jgi:tRNA(Ile)-lysidine synthase
MSRVRTRRDGGGEKLGDFARRLLAEWRRLGWATRGERVVVAVSGGADSTALLFALEELTKAGRLGLEVTAAHLDHGLRGEQGAADARWVAARARALGFDVVTGRADVGKRARGERDNLEQAARRTRYGFLSEVARERGASAVLVAHTLDDQAETVLLRLLRGSGADGAGGMRPERVLEEAAATPEQGSGILLRRPLLGWARRADTESYCRERGVEFRADAMNEDESFARVRARRRLVPLLETFNPRAVEALARAAELLREDSDALEGLASELLEQSQANAQATTGGGGKRESGNKCARPLRVEVLAPLLVEVLASAHPALRRRALRQWIARGRGGLRRIEFAHVLAVEHLLEGTRGGRVAELPGGCSVERRRGLLIFRRTIYAGNRR